MIKYLYKKIISVFIVRCTDANIEHLYRGVWLTTRLLQTSNFKLVPDHLLLFQTEIVHPILYINRIFRISLPWSAHFSGLHSWGELMPVQNPGPWISAAVLKLTIVWNYDDLLGTADFTKPTNNRLVRRQGSAVSNPDAGRRHDLCGLVSVEIHQETAASRSIICSQGWKKFLSQMRPRPWKRRGLPY